MGTGLSVFDATIQETNEWLRRIEETLPPCGRRHAYEALRAVLHALRDRLPLPVAAGLSAQLPILVRGIFFEGWHAGAAPAHSRDRDDFAAVVGAALPPGFPREPDAAIEAVFAAMAARLDPGETAKIIKHLPGPLRGFWPAGHRAA